MTLKQIDLNVSGMTCAACVGRVERALKKSPGVEDVAVNLVTEKARVSFHPEETSAAELIQRVRDSGYQAALDVVPVKRPANWELPAALALCFPLVGPMLLNRHDLIPASIQFVLATLIQFGLARRFYASAWKALLAKSGNMDLLVVVGSLAAYALSLYLWSLGHAHLYFESSAMVLTMVLLGKDLEGRAKGQTGEALRSLAKLRPEEVRVWKDGRFVSAASSSLVVGDRVLVRSGERVGADGVIVVGETEVDEALLTGESHPVLKRVGSEVVAGSVNRLSPVEVEVRSVGHETMLARIVRLMEDAQASKPPIQRLVDRVSAVFVPVVLGLSLLTLAAVWFSASSWEVAIVRATAVLVIACPCALGLATPTALVAGIGSAARAGILLKDADVIEAVSRIDSVIFDKTGTLTQGSPRVERFRVLAGGETEFWETLGSLQVRSEHPLARAVGEKAQLKYPLPVEDARVVAGQGIEATLRGKSFYFGRMRPGLELPAEARSWEMAGDTVSVLFQGDSLIGYVGFVDALREESRRAIELLAARKVRTVILSGDGDGSVSRVARELNVSEFHARMLPQQKLEFVRQAQARGQRVVMVGDGVNDAPALAQADVGMALVQSADVVVQAASIALLRPNPLLVVDALAISAAIRRKIVQNLFWAFGYNVIGIPLAALGYLSPMLAGSLMALSSVSVMASSLLLKRWRAQAR